MEEVAAVLERLDVDWNTVCHEKFFLSRSSNTAYRDRIYGNSVVPRERSHPDQGIAFGCSRDDRKKVSRCEIELRRERQRAKRLCLLHRCTVGRGDVANGHGHGSGRDPAGGSLNGRLVRESQSEGLDMVFLPRRGRASLADSGLGRDFQSRF